jgi:hypothetical protein
MVQALGYSQTLFDPVSPGRLCRGRERWIESFPLDGKQPLERLVISGASFSDDTARDAKRGLPFAGVSCGQVLDLLFPDQVLLAFCEQGQVDALPPAAIMIEPHLQPRFGGRRIDRCVRWRVPVQGAADFDALVGDHPGAADGFLPWAGELSEPLEEALFLLTGQGDRLGFPLRRFQPSALPTLLEIVPWVALIHMDKHGPALGIYSREPLGLDPALASAGERFDTLSVPFSIPPMLARWDRALYELRQGWPADTEFPVPPGEARPPAYERPKVEAPKPQAVEE